MRIKFFKILLTEYVSETTHQSLLPQNVWTSQSIEYKLIYDLLLPYNNDGKV